MGGKQRNPFRKLCFLASRQSCRAGPGLRNGPGREDARLSDAQPCARGSERHGAWSTRHEGHFFLPQLGSEQAWCWGRENNLAYCSGN